MFSRSTFPFYMYLVKPIIMVCHDAKWANPVKLAYIFEPTFKNDTKFSPLGYLSMSDDFRTSWTKNQASKHSGLPSEDTKTTPRPTPRGAPMFKNFSLGAHMATVERPPTTPAVYHAALMRRGPPSIVRGATTAPITPGERASRQLNIY